MKKLFIKYMEDKRLSDKTKNHYISGLTSRINAFAKKYCPDYVSVFDLKKEVAIKLIEQLKQDISFLDYYKKSHGSPISAFNKYLEFLDSEDNKRSNNIVGATECSTIIEVPPFNEKISVWVNRYERDKEKRDRCIAEKGLNCYVCGMNFKDTYGDIGQEFIHVHHIEFLSMNGKDNVENMIPVCPNCHAMLHKSYNGRTLEYEELKKILKNRKS